MKGYGETVGPYKQNKSHNAYETGMKFK
jgi:hypothetical protein